MAKKQTTLRMVRSTFEPLFLMVEVLTVNDKEENFMVRQKKKLKRK